MSSLHENTNKSIAEYNLAQTQAYKNLQVNFKQNQLAEEAKASNAFNNQRRAVLAALAKDKETNRIQQLQEIKEIIDRRK